MGDFIGCKLVNSLCLYIIYLHNDIYMGDAVECDLVNSLYLYVIYLCDIKWVMLLNVIS